MRCQPASAIVMVSHMGMHATPQYWPPAHLGLDTSVSGQFCLAGDKSLKIVPLVAACWLAQPAGPGRLRPAASGPAVLPRGGVPRRAAAWPASAAPGREEETHAEAGDIPGPRRLETRITGNKHSGHLAKLARRLLAESREMKSRRRHIRHSEVTDVPPVGVRPRPPRASRTAGEWLTGICRIPRAARIDLACARSPDPLPAVSPMQTRGRYTITGLARGRERAHTPAGQVAIAGG